VARLRYALARQPRSCVRFEPWLVGSAGNAPVRRFRHMFKDARFTVEQPDHFPENW
jgi:hypothetical protein